MQTLNQILPVTECKERRKFVRYNEGAMKVWIKRRGLINEFIRGEAAEWFNFNRYGMAFTSRSRLDIHEEILINLKMTHLSICNLVAVIHNARQQAGKFRYGVQFYFGANSHMQSSEIQELLIDAERFLD